MWVLVGMGIAAAASILAILTWGRPDPDLAFEGEDRPRPRYRDPYEYGSPIVPVDEMPTDIPQLAVPTSFGDTVTIRREDVTEEQWAWMQEFLAARDGRL